MPKHVRGLTSLLITLVVVLAGAIAFAAPASAASRDGKCDSGEFCYYFNSGEAGSISDFTDSIDDYGTTQPTCYEFKGAGNGQGVCVKNNAASVWNRTGKTVRVYFNSNFAGSHQDFAAGAKGNLNATLKNNNASHELLSSAPTGCKTDGTNTTLPSTILVYRVSLGRVDRVAFKTYVKNVLPNEWISSWPAASLNAGAMAVKSYGWYWALHSTRTTPGGACYDVRDDTGDQVYQPSFGGDLHECGGGPHLDHPDDPQRQHPAGALLLDDDSLRRLGRRELDVPVRLARPGRGRQGVRRDPEVLLRRHRAHLLSHSSRSQGRPSRRRAVGGPRDVGARNSPDPRCFAPYARP